MFLKSIHFNPYFLYLAKTQLNSLFWLPLRMIKNSAYFLLLYWHPLVLISPRPTCYSRHCWQPAPRSDSPQPHHTSFSAPRLLQYCAISRTPVGTFYVLLHAQQQGPVSQPLMTRDSKSMRKCFPPISLGRQFWGTLYTASRKTPVPLSSIQLQQWPML